MSRDEVNAVLTDEVRAELRRTGRKLMVGVLAIHKTLAGQPLDAPWKWRYPKPSDIAGIFSDSRHCLNLVHFNTKEPNIHSQMKAVQELAGPYFDGFQLNVDSPDPHWLWEWRFDGSYEESLVIQLGTKVLDRCQDTDDLKTWLSQYRDLDAVFLVDPSGGQGKTFPVNAGLVIEHIYRAVGSRARVGIAGGLGPDPASLTNVVPLLAKWPNLSLDAEGKLRTVVDPATGEDRLDTDKARTYVLNALRLIK